MIPNPTTDRAAFWQMARAMASWSARAYHETTVADPNTSASALVTLDQEGDVIVAFQGSHEPKDFLQDMEMWRTPLIWSYCMSAEVHHGFLEDFNAIDANIVGCVRGMLALNPKARIYICGHSLGGALAILCALLFSRQNLPVAGVFTFGCPRVGNTAFAAMYDHTVVHACSSCSSSSSSSSSADEHGDGLWLRDITFRIVNQNDIVPRVPGPWWPQYRHCGTEIFLEPTPAFGYQVAPELFYKVIADLMGLYAAYRNRRDVLISQHFMRAYQERIASL